MSIHSYARNPLKRAVAEMLQESQHGKCAKCERETDLEIDHIDGNPTNWKITNLRLLCHGCNISERNRLNGLGSVKERERESADAALTWSNEEGRRSSKMVPRYRAVMYHPKTGMFKDEGSRMPIVKLSHNLPELCGGLGSSITYRRYIEDDIASGFLFRSENDGIEYVERTDKHYPLERLGMQAAKITATAQTVPTNPTQ